MKRRHIQLTDEANAVIDRLYGEHVRVNRMLSEVLCAFDAQWRNSVATLFSHDILYSEFMTASEAIERSAPANSDAALRCLQFDAFPKWFKSTPERWDNTVACLSRNPGVFAALLIVHRARMCKAHNAIKEQFSWLST